MASAWRVPLTLIHIKGRDVLEQMSRSGDDTWLTAHSTAGRKVCWEVPISSNAAEGMTPCCEIMFSRSVPSRITPADTLAHAGRSAVRPFDPWTTPLPLSTRTHEPTTPRSTPGPLHQVTEEKGNKKLKPASEPHLWVNTNIFWCHALSISCLAGFSEQVISVIQSLHRRNCPPWNGRSAKQTLILSATEISFSVCSYLSSISRHVLPEINIPHCVLRLSWRNAPVLWKNSAVEKKGLRGQRSPVLVTPEMQQ